MSLSGTRKAKRYRSIKVQYQNERFETCLKSVTGFTLQIILHVVEYLDMVDEVYLEEDGTYFHDVYYKEDGPDSNDNDMQQS